MILKSHLMANRPPDWPIDPFPQIQALLQRDLRKVVVLDDDPTGTQTVHGVPVLTKWSVQALADELRTGLTCFYVLTNTRAMPLVAAQALNTEIGQNLAQAMRQTGRAVVLVSRSDSTLRGHFPGETDALLAALGQPMDATVIMPAFMAGRRRTIGDVHYVGAIGNTNNADGEEWLTPAGETEFAQDTAFGYHASNLKAWVVEKTGGRIAFDEVSSITLDHIRTGGPDEVMRQMLAVPAAGVCVVNAASERDLAVAVLGIMQAEQVGRRFLFRTAASFVQWRAGIATQSLLSRDELLSNETNPHGGLTIIGSYIPKTSAQLTHLLQRSIPDGLHVYVLEIEVARWINEDTRADDIVQAAQQVDAQLRQGRDVVIYTSRALISGTDAASSLDIGRRVSAGLVQLVQQLTVRPRYVLAKGGITSSDIATAGLGVRRALVLGQILPGVPVWQLGAETKWPSAPYIVFPGNVGGDQALAEVVRLLS